MFDKSEEVFTIKKNYIFLSHCGISPLYKGALQKEIELAQLHHTKGSLIFEDYNNILDQLRQSAAQLLKTSPWNLSFVKNTSEGMNLIANGYPFEKGDQIITYTHEYPANYYPWKLQETRGAELVLLSNTDITGVAPEGLPSGWSMAELEQRVTSKTKIIAISHVQYTSGFAADLQTLADFCKERDIDLVVDAAQSLGCLPLEPEALDLAAVISAGWKWLMGPIGTGLLYTSEKFRNKLDHTVVGAEVMHQGTDYLDLTWNPHQTSKRFEYSTSPIVLAGALERCIAEIPLRYGVAKICEEVYRLQSIFLEVIDHAKYTPLLYPEVHRSLILAFKCQSNAQAVAHALPEKGIICTSRGGYLRFAPHFYISDEDVEKAAHILNRLEV